MSSIADSEDGDQEMHEDRISSKCAQLPDNK